MRGGNHIGKIVISNMNGFNEKTKIPVSHPCVIVAVVKCLTVQARPAARELILRFDVSYLIIGGLKGLCGSVTIYLAQSGAKHLVVLSRSGYGDRRSQGALKNIYAQGCRIDLVKGDGSSLEIVQRAFESATARIGGLFQGAMVLRVGNTVTQFQLSIP